MKTKFRKIKKNKTKREKHLQTQLFIYIDKTIKASV